MLVKIASTIGSLTFLSRVLGYIRDLLFAKYFGASLISDAFLVAFKLPNLFRRLFAEGAMNSAFVPVVSGIQSQKGGFEATMFMSKVLSITFLGLLPLVIIVEISMPILIHLIAPGFNNDPQKFNLTILLSRITFPFLIFISLSSLIGGFLSTINRFAAMAFTPIILNLTIIFTLLYFNSINYIGSQLTIVAAYAISLAGIFQLLWLVFHLYRNSVSLKLKYLFNRKIFEITEPTKRLFKLFLPAVIGNGIYQLNLLVDMILASTLPSGSISFLYFSDRINQLPLGVLGISISTALLPMLSKQIKENLISKYQKTANECIILCLIVSVPATFGIFLISDYIIELLFVRGEFSVNDAKLTGMSLRALCIGLPAFILIKVLSVIFFSREDTRTPVLVGFFSLLVNLFFNLLLIKKYNHVGLALATSISAWVNVAILYYILKKREIISFKRNIIEVLLKSIMSSILMFYLLRYFMYKYMIIGSFLAKLSFLSIVVASGIILYVFLLYILKTSYLKVKR